MPDKKCPLVMLGRLISYSISKGVDIGKNHSNCIQNECQWWTTYYPGESIEYGECAISALSFLADMVE